MTLFELLWNTSQKRTLYIIVISIINGICGGIILILFPEAALNIFTEGKYLFYLTWLPPVTIVFILSKRISRKMTSLLAENACEKMILEIANTVRHFELAEFEKHGETDINTSIASSKLISSAAEKNIDSIQNNIILAIGWLYIFFYLSYFLGIIILVWRLLYFSLWETFRNITGSFAKEELQKQNILFQIVKNHLYGFKELKFNKIKDHSIFSDYLKPLAEKIKEIRIQSRLYVTELTLIYFISLFIIIALSNIFFTGSSPAGAPIKVSIMLLYALQIDFVLLASMPNIAEGKAALQRFNQLFSPDEIKYPEQRIKTIHNKQHYNFNEIKMENIKFFYPEKEGDDKPFAIQIENMTIKSGEILFITGGNGSGKSTLMNILAGFYLPDSGFIKIDGRPVKIRDYRHLFSVVMADFHLFNKIYGIENIDENYMNELLELTGLKDKVNYRNGAFSTLDLSTGQKKRLALVVSLIEDKPIYLFDEWAADQDPHFRRYFYEYLLPWLKKKGKTVIAITHDDRYFNAADKIIKMDYGRVSERKRLISGISKTSSSFWAHKGEYHEKRAIDIYCEYTDEKIFPKKKDKTKKSDGIIEKLKNILEVDSSSVKKLFFRMVLSSLSLIGVMTSLFSLTHIRPGEAPEIIFVRFLIFLLLFIFMFRRLQRFFYRLIERRITNLRINCIKNIRKTDLETMEQIGSSKIYTVLTSDTQAIAAISNIFLVCSQGVLRTFMLSCYIGFICPKALLLMLLIGGAGAVLYILNHIAIVKLFEKVRMREKEMVDAITHLLKGFKELRLDSKKSNDFYFQTLRPCVSKLRYLRIRSSQHYTNNHTIVYAFWKGLLLSVILGAPYIGIAPEILPVIVGLIFILPLRQIIDFYSQFHIAYMSFNRLQEFEEEIKNLDSESIEAAPEEEIKQYENIHYENIAYTYRTSDDNPFTVGPVDLGFKKGEILFLTGGNGSGKSTLLKLMTGLYKGSGQSCFNGKETDIRRYREIFSVIFSDFHLFDRFYGMKNIDENKINKLLEEFELKKRVECVDGKFSTLDLSTGQKKRLALLTTIIEDKPIYVFDEWAADQDPQFRKYFYEELLPSFKKQGKTVIAVSHDDRYFSAADRIINLQYGQIG